MLFAILCYLATNNGEKMSLDGEMSLMGIDEIGRFENFDSTISQDGMIDQNDLDVLFMSPQLLEEYVSHQLVPTLNGESFCKKAFKCSSTKFCIEPIFENSNYSYCKCENKQTQGCSIKNRKFKSNLNFSELVEILNNDLALNALGQ